MKTIKLSLALKGLCYCPKCKTVYYCKKDCDCDELPGDLTK